MSYISKSLLVVALVSGVTAAPIASLAAPSAKSEGASNAKGSQVDEFEENRKAHMQKSKENNAKKGAE